MVRICPQCGTTSLMGTTECPNCKNSLLPLIENELAALKDMRIYSIIVLAFALLGTVSYILNIFHAGGISSGIFALFGLGLAGAPPVTITTLFILLEAAIILSLFLQAVSFVYLRSCFSKLMPNDFHFSSPKTGTTILIIGLIMAMIGLAVILALIIPLAATSSGNVSSQPGLLALLALSGFIVIIGGILVFIGYILGVLLGTHRMATKFEESLFDFGWILLLLSFLFSPLALIAGILFLQGTKTTKKRLTDVKSGTTV